MQPLTHKFIFINTATQGLSLYKQCDSIVQTRKVLGTCTQPMRKDMVVVMNYHGKNISVKGSEFIELFKHGYNTTQVKKKLNIS